MTDEPDYLNDLREQLLQQYEQTVSPKFAAAKKRRQVLGRTARELAIQTLATALGGGIVAAGAIALGWLNSDPDLRVAAGAGAVVLLVALVAALWALTTPLTTADDANLASQIRWVDAAIADRDERRRADPRTSRDADETGAAHP